MNPSPYQPWVNLLTLLPGTSLTLLTIAVAFLRFYNEQDFRLLGYLTEPRVWSNRLTVAARPVAVVNFGVVGRSPCAAWNLRNRERNRLAEEEQRRAEERERAARRARVEARCRAAQIRFQLEPSQGNRQSLGAVLAVLEEYGDTL